MILWYGQHGRSLNDDVTFSRFSAKQPRNQELSKCFDHRKMCEQPQKSTYFNCRLQIFLLTYRMGLLFVLSFNFFNLSSDAMNDLAVFIVIIIIICGRLALKLFELPIYEQPALPFFELSPRKILFLFTIVMQHCRKTQSSYLKVLSEAIQ